MLSESIATSAVTAFMLARNRSMTRLTMAMRPGHWRMPASKLPSPMASKQPTASSIERTCPSTMPLSAWATSPRSPG
ncbi:hypothetical protein DWF04_014390 [Cereibacter sphaeroides f. sp. denitrificans]